MVSRPQEVSTDAEQILHDTVNRREPLELSGRLEPPHLALPLSGRLMGNLRAVVRVLIGAVKHRWHHRATGGRVAAQLIGNQGSGRPGSLLTLVYPTHYHHERNHQGLDNRLILPLSTAPLPYGRVLCRHRLGRMLNYYYRSAA